MDQVFLGLRRIFESFCLSCVQREKLCLNSINKSPVSQLTSSTVVCLSVTVSGTVQCTNQQNVLSLDRDAADSHQQAASWRQLRWKVVLINANWSAAYGE